MAPLSSSPSLQGGDGDGLSPQEKAAAKREVKRLVTQIGVAADIPKAVVAAFEAA